MSERANRVALYAAVVLVAGGALFYIGWQLRMGILKGQSFATLVSVNAALLFILVGTSCLLQRSPKRIFVNAGQALGITVALLPALTIAVHLLGMDFGTVERIVLPHRLSDWAPHNPSGRTALPTLVAFFFAGLGLIGIRIGRAVNATNWCAAVVAAISYLALIGYGYTLPKLYGGLMTLPIAVLLGFVALALCTARSDSIVISKDAGGVVFRRVVIPLLLLMPLIGFLRIRAQQRFALGLEMGTGLLVVVVVFLFTALTARTAGVLNDLDIKRKNAEESLIRAEKLAAAGRLSATIAHEINNPLAAVMNLLYLARTADSLTKSTEYIRGAEDELQRAAKIARRTLGFYRDDTQPVDVTLATLVQESLEIFRGKVSALNICVDTALEPAARVHVRPGEIRQIVVNLLGNAIEAVQMENVPKINLAVREHSDSVQLVVADNGCGIPSQELQRIFEPFFTTKKDVGIGLGLYISRQLAEKNGGSLRLESSTQPDQHGTIFYLTLPAISSVEEPVSLLEGGESRGQSAGQ